MKDEEIPRSEPRGETREHVEHQFTNAIFTFTRTYDPTTHAHTTNFSFSNPPKNFMDGLTRLTQWLPILRESLGHGEHGEGEAEEEHVIVTVTDEIIGTIPFVSLDCLNFICSMKCSALYDGQVDLEYQKDDETWTVLSSITGDGVNVKQSIATASLLAADNVSAPVAKYAFVLRCKVHTQATAGSVIIRLDTGQ